MFQVRPATPSRTKQEKKKKKGGEAERPSTSLSLWEITSILLHLHGNYDNDLKRCIFRETVGDVKKKKWNQQESYVGSNYEIILDTFRSGEESSGGCSASGVSLPGWESARTLLAPYLCVVHLQRTSNRCSCRRVAPRQRVQKPLSSLLCSYCVLISQPFVLFVVMVSLLAAGKECGNRLWGAPCGDEQNNKKKKNCALHRQKCAEEFWWQLVRAAGSWRVSSRRRRCAVYPPRRSKNIKEK